MDVIAVDRADLTRLPDSVSSEQVNLISADLGNLFSGADAVVHLATTFGVSSADITEAELELALFRRVLDAVGVAGVTHFVMMSSAAVYGAWTNNPVPLTENAPVHPNPEFDWAVQRFELERQARQWAMKPSNGEPRTVTVLRPAAVVAEDRLGNLARTLRAARAGVAAAGNPSVQYLHADDLASAVVVVLQARYDGTINVAPDGWIPPDGFADLEGPRPRLRVAIDVAKAVSALRWQWGAPTPPGVVPYTVHSWVVANDRLKELGWTPAHTNEEAWVVSHEPGTWESLPARRRQEVLLTLAAAGTLGLSALIIWGIARLRPRH